MARYIDADALTDMLLTENQRCVTSTGHELTMNMIVSFINHQPTIFDMKKVVAELEENKNKACSSAVIWAYKRAIRLVREGGNDDKDR